MSIFTIENSRKSMVNRFDDNEEVQEDRLLHQVEPLSDEEVVEGISLRPFVIDQQSEYTAPLFQIAGFRVNHMHIDLASVALMALLVIISLVSHFRR